MTEKKYDRRRVVLLEQTVDQQVQDAADSAGLNVSSWIRTLILRELATTTPTSSTT